MVIHTVLEAWRQINLTIALTWKDEGVPFDKLAKVGADRGFVNRMKQQESVSLNY